MQVLPPGDAGMLHFGGDHGCGRFGGEEQLEPFGAVLPGARRRQGRLLCGVFGPKFLGRVAGRCPVARILEECALLGRRCGRLEGARRLEVLIQRDLVGSPRVVGVCCELGTGQDIAAQRQVITAVQLHSGRQQGGVPVLGAVPDPARRRAAVRPAFQVAYDGGKLAHADHVRFRGVGVGVSRLGEFLESCALGVGGEQQVHTTILPCRRGGLVRAGAGLRGAAPGCPPHPRHPAIARLCPHSSNLGLRLRPRRVSVAL